MQQVLAQIERKLAGFLGDAEQPVEVKKQVQVLIEEATDMRNLAQGKYPLRIKHLLMDRICIRVDAALVIKPSQVASPG